MKNKRFIAVCLASSMLLSAVADFPQRNTPFRAMTAAAEDVVNGTYQDVFSYKAYEDYVEITQYLGYYDEEITVPSVIDGLPVTNVSNTYGH